MIRRLLNLAGLFVELKRVLVGVIFIILGHVILLYFGDLYIFIIFFIVCKLVGVLKFVFFLAGPRPCVSKCVCVWFVSFMGMLPLE